MACLVEFGEVLARLIVHATDANDVATLRSTLSREQAILALENIIKKS